MELRAMKRLLQLVNFCLMVLVFLLVGCRNQQAAVEPDKASLIRLLEQAAVPEQVYTTASYEALQKAAASSAAVRDDEHATQGQVDRAAKNLSDSLDNLAVATNGVYRIECKLSLQSNDSVGDEWDVSFCCNGQAIYNGQEVVVPLGTAITVSGTVLEQDKIPDTGTGQVQLTAENGYKETATIVVNEKGGRFAGHRAVWEWICKASLVELT